MGIGQRGSGKWRRRERVEGEIERRGSVSWRLGLEGSAGPWAGLGRRVRWAAAGEAGWVGPSGEEMARGLAGLISLFSLLYFL